MSNELLYNFIRENASDSYRERVPVVTQENISEVGNYLLENTETRNEFFNILVNKFAFSLVSSDELDSEFRQFAGRKLETGDTIEDIFVEMAKAIGEVVLVDGESIDPFKITKAQLSVLYHKIDAKNVYPVTLENERTKRALLSGGSMNDLTTAIVGSLKNGREYDHYLRGVELLSRAKIYGKNYAVTGQGSEVKLAGQVLGALKDVLSKMGFVRKDYNALEVETKTPASEKIVFIREDVLNSIDVNLLSGIFNMNKMQLDTQMIVIDKFVPSVSAEDEYIKDNILAVVVDRRGLRIHNVEESIESQRNGLGQYTNYFMHASDIFSFSAFRNAIVITGEVGLPTVEETGTTGV